ncbi:hypothetical protein [Halosolutus gelatinilyticus]|uniref:hypothetical protein n=1 Tax=Halosolutus gelatinilyticus TaxID=2931975 RepID=UPI001FF19017|nr:hypothetical protein [Halosolutus gelatinilyticus]
MKDEIVDALHQPEYTGENRCEACTVVNLVIAGVLGAVVARKSKLSGAIAVAASVALIYLRGYLVPGTPTLTKRYLPPEVLRWFGKEPSEPEIRSGLGAIDSPAAEPSPIDGGSGAGRRPAAEDDRELAFDEGGRESGADEARAETAAVQISDPETYFLDHDVVEPCDDVDDLCLTEAFETVWADEIDAGDADAIDAGDAASAFGFDDFEAADGEDGTEPDSIDDAFEIERYDDARVLKRDGMVVGKWPSQAALVADVTAARALEDRDDDWESYGSETKGQLLNSLRLFLETCPTSGGEVVMSEETVESCCQSHDVVAVTCEDTGERLFEHRVDAIEQ